MQWKKNTLKSETKSISLKLISEWYKKFLQVVKERLVQQGQRPRQTRADFCTQAMVFSALASRIIDPLIAINMSQVSCKGFSYPRTGMDTEQQGWP